MGCRSRARKGSFFPPSSPSSDFPNRGHYEEKQGDGQNESGYGAFKEKEKSPVTHRQRLAEVEFQHWAQNQGKDQRCGLEIELPQEVSKDAKENHNPDFSDTVVQTVGTDHAKKQYQGKKDRIRNL
jgi:hypothetical protein